MKSSLALALALVGALAAPAGAAALPTVAVMPFRDLSGGRGAVGEAIRETVTTDLKDVSGLRVIERGNLDRVLAEQNLQASRADLDPLSTVKVGKLLGATLIVAGAYQRAARTVRLTARFVRVETGEIVGTAKVDGPASDFLHLQDQVTAALLRSAGMGRREVEKFARRARPKLKSLKTVELYGDAVVQTDDQKKKELLELALNEDPGFSYAARDLDALEKRMKGYEAAAARAQVRALAELDARLAKEKDPQKRGALVIQMMGALASSRRWHAMEGVARKIASGPPMPGALPSAPSANEVAGLYLVQAESALKERDATLRDGERFLKRYPSSMYFQSVEGIMQMTIADKRRVEQGRGEVNAALARLSSRDRWNLCRVAQVYRAHAQRPEAERLFRACFEVGTEPPAEALRQLIPADIDNGDFENARKDLEALEKSGHDDPGWRHMIEYGIPGDG